MTNKNKLLSVVSHASCLFTSIIVSLLVPIGIAMHSNDDDVTFDNAIEALNFQISMFIYAIMSFVVFAAGMVLAAISNGLDLSAVIVSNSGLLMLIGVALWNLIAPIVKIIQVLRSPSQPARYALIFRFVK